ncbi:MAG: hypothetical protein NWF04_03305 [Candidatus Bathyarchaeota archaeon]|nr:hypothetical protein [Candidatus Bathyarchaeota archaeon]
MEVNEMITFNAQHPKLDLKAFLAISSAIFLLALGPIIACKALEFGLLAFGVKLSVLDLVFVSQNMPYLGLIPQVIGGVVLIFYCFRSRFQVDYSKVKRQLTRTGLIAGILLTILVSSVTFAPVVKADLITTGSFSLQTPLPIASAYVGEYTNGSYFAVHGSDWTTFITSEDKTYVEQMAIGNISSGTLYLGDVSWDYQNLSIPSGIIVEEHYRANVRYFINDADAQGSSYMVSVGSGDDAGYYLVQDSQDRYILESDNASDVVEQVLAQMSTGGIVEFGKGNFYNFSAVITGDYPQSWDSVGATWTIKGQGMNVTCFNGAPAKDVWTVKNCARVNFEDFAIALPTTNSGEGIVGDDQDVTTTYAGTPFDYGSTISNVYIHGGSAGKWCVNIDNPEGMTISNTILKATGAGGWRLTQTSTLYNFGDSVFNGINIVGVFANNGIGLLFDASETAVSGGRRLNHMSSSNQLSLFSNYHCSNTTGLWAKYLLYSTLSAIHTESIESPVCIDHVSYCDFSGDKYWSSLLGDVFWDTTANAHANTIRNFLLVVSSQNCCAINDANTDSNSLNIYENWQIVAQTNININNSLAISYKNHGSIVRNMQLLSAGGTFADFLTIPSGYIGEYCVYEDDTALIPYGGTETIQNDTTYSCPMAPMTIYYSGGDMISILVDGESIPLIGVVTVPMGHTVKFVWSDATPTFVAVNDNSR